MGYSEPGAGSDLASLSCRAELNGDHYVINGRKVWTSDAMDCDYIFILARTDPDAPKHKGISLILVDMHQPGVQVSPIRLLSGASPFNETVFENAIAPAADVIGGINNGWTVGKRLLQFEAFDPRRHQYIRFPRRPNPRQRAAQAAGALSKQSTRTATRVDSP